VAVDGPLTKMENDATNAGIEERSRRTGGATKRYDFERPTCPDVMAGFQRCLRTLNGEMGARSTFDGGGAGVDGEDGERRRD
jgi:hypothetical protein